VVADAVAAEHLGFDSFWLGEHRFWYDGWCPQPLLVAAAAAAATRTLHIGTAMLLLPEHDPGLVARKLDTVEALFADRLELGVALGYRPEEYAGMGLSIGRRGRLMDAALDVVGAGGRASRVWIGGMAPAAIERAGRRGLPLMLPPTLSVKKVASLVALARETAQSVGAVVPRIGMLRDVWVDRDPAAARGYYLPRLTNHYREYVTAWWVRDQTGTVDASRVPAQVERNVAAALVGDPDGVAEQLLEFVDAGVDTLVLQVYTEETRDQTGAQLADIAQELVPRLRGGR
jgi:alkanesulfonate monooxygenase SsuD/methylene tetrahydromethanopterin reductase-like flavin-dependent oxidoreductase (luciferase family)